MPGIGGCTAAGYDVTRFLEGESIRYDVRRGGGPMPPVDAIGELGVRFPAGDVAMREYARKGGDRPVPYSPEGTVTAFRGRGRRWVRPGRGRPPYRRHCPGAQRSSRISIDAPGNPSPHEGQPPRSAAGHGGTGNGVRRRRGARYRMDTG